MAVPKDHYTYLSNGELVALLASFAKPGQRKGSIEKLYDCFAPQFHAYLIRRGCPNSDREEIIHDSFVKFIQHLDKHQKKKGNYCPQHPKAYFHAIFRNSYSAYLRKQERTVNLVGLDELLAYAVGADGEETFSLRETFRKLYKEYTLSNPLCVFAFEQIALEELSQKELAVIIDKTYGATRQFVKTCRERFISLWQACTS
ncbi:RNA polymerase sigma factor [Desulfogranum mediterraneum]|uniref:RNA polymerase sigma factor n=1 Tax=Desulfogranum mediterraneum TaxID=160661 RepID=UPI0003FE717C|nr:sigma-70 family RNA polymerase sigma factor [Desulfogranum mediterraneum]